MNFKSFDWQHWVLTIGGIAMGLAGLFAHTPGAPAWLGWVTPVVLVIFVNLGLHKTSPADSVSAPATKAAGFVRLPLLVVLAALALPVVPTAQMQGCHASTEQLDKTARDASHLGGCIIGTIIGGGVTDPGSVAQACGGALPAVIVDVIDDFLAKQPPVINGGVGASPQRALLERAKAKAQGAFEASRRP